MSWVRLDDGAPEHRKLLALKRTDRWTWIELLAYCARQGDCHIPPTVGEILRFVTPAFLAKCREVGLIDVSDEGDMEIHDWATYNPKDPTNALRQARYRNAQRNAEGNGEERYEERDENRYVTAPRAQQRARGPSRPVPLISENDDDGRDGVDVVVDLSNLIESLKPSSTQRLKWQLYATVNPAKAQRLLTYSLEHGDNPAAYFDRLVDADADVGESSSGGPPAAPLDPAVERARADRLARIPPRICPECEIGGGKHVEGCSLAVSVPPASEDPF